MLFFIGSFFIGALFGVCGLGPLGLFITLGLIYARRELRKWEAYADRQVSYNTDYDRVLAKMFRDMQQEAAHRERQERLKGAEDVEFRVIR